jgi:hypothetical protein
MRDGANKHTQHTQKQTLKFTKSNKQISIHKSQVRKFSKEITKASMLGS